MTAAIEGGAWLSARPGRTLPMGKTRYPFYSRLGGPPGPVWTGGKSLPHLDSIPERPARSSVAIPTELPGPTFGFFVFHRNSRILYLYPTGTDYNENYSQTSLFMERLFITVDPVGHSQPAHCHLHIIINLMCS